MLSDALSTYTYVAENLISQPRVIREETGAQSPAGIPLLKFNRKINLLLTTTASEYYSAAVWSE
jgi:hypothetical protein